MNFPAQMTRVMVVVALGSAASALACGGAPVALGALPMTNAASLPVQWAVGGALGSALVVGWAVQERARLGRLKRVAAAALALALLGPTFAWARAEWTEPRALDRLRAVVSPPEPRLQVKCGIRNFTEVQDY